MAVAPGEVCTWLANKELIVDAMMIGGLLSHVLLPIIPQQTNIHKHQYIYYPDQGLDVECVQLTLRKLFSSQEEVLERQISE